MPVTTTRSLIDTERAHLLTVLDGLDPAGWATPSSCAGWTVRDVAAHLLMPYELGVPGLLVGLVRARMSFDRFAARRASDDPRTTDQVVAALRDTAGRSFRVPGASEKSELAHLVCHAEDVYRPLGVAGRTDVEARAVTLDELFAHRGAIRPGLLDGLSLSATDTDWTHGDGPLVNASASALVSTIGGRTAALTEMSGPGAATLCDRLRPAVG